DLNLDGVEQHTNPRARCREIRRMREVAVDGRRDSISDAGLLDESRQEYHHCAPHVDIGKLLGRNELRQKVHCAHNRPCDQWREKTHEQRKIDKIRNGTLLPAVHVDRVAHRVKRVEANADWQNNVERVHACRQTKPRQKPGRRRYKKVKVFEKSQDTEIDAYAGGNPEAPPCRTFASSEHLSDDVIHRRGPENQECKFPVPSRVKTIAAEEKPHLSRGVVAHRPVDDEHGQKKPEEPKFNERHSDRDWEAKLNRQPLIVDHLISPARASSTKFAATMRVISSAPDLVRCCPSRRTLLR